jgi:hypothetical protein
MPLSGDALFLIYGPGMHFVMHFRGDRVGRHWGMMKAVTSTSFLIFQQILCRSAGAAAAELSEGPLYSGVSRRRGQAPH